MSDPHTIGKYQLIAEIARGGMGIVYLAVVRGPGGFSKLLVLKELRPELVGDEAYLAMFLEEARLAAKLSHPNVVHTYEVGQEGDLHFLVMDYLDGRALSRIVRKRSPTFTQAMQLRVLAEVLRGLEYAHGLVDFDGSPAGVVHRDMTPQNVFVTFDGQVKVVDFGIAKAADSSLETQAGVLKGKPAYMPPEQIAGKVDARSDVFAVGAMMWEAIAGRKMWQGKSDIEILTLLLKGEVPILADVVPDTSPELLAIVARATSPSLEGRYDSARALRNDLEAYLRSIGAPDSRDIGPVVAALFERERESTRATLEAALAEAKRGTQRSLPTLGAAASTDGTPSGATSRGSGPRSFLTPGLTPGVAITSQSPPGPARRGAWVPVLFLLLAMAGVIGFLLARPRVDPELASGSRSALSAGMPELAMPAPSSSAAPTVANGSSIVAGPLAVDAATQEQPTTSAHSKTRHAAPAAAAGRAANEPAAPAAPAAKADCNPPFFYEGTKKVFKPGCL